MEVAALIGLAQAIGPLIKLYSDGKAALEQTGAMTDADRAKLKAAEEAAFGSHAWKTDDEGGL